ncbi:cytotoxic translational repressor of toxin-antitoxin stability system [Desulfovibrio sp. OttesenSCG-928-C14]|nr:cytotoxic translational repressor of toxin-antitoxin stability system [Desulfovibrio sp. OttesenSCG-928-C14]
MNQNFWRVVLSRKTAKALPKLPERIKEILALLIADIEEGGPVRGDWPNYGKLGPNTHHCHLKKGKPTYVAVWIETEVGVQVEVTYAGTHEKAPY